MIRQKSNSLIKTGLSVFMKFLAGINLITFPVYGGTEHRASFKYDNLQRTFHIHIPPLYDGSEQLPLVIALHGRGETEKAWFLLPAEVLTSWLIRMDFLLLIRMV